MLNLALSYSLAMNMSMHSYSIIIGVEIAILHELLMFRSMTIPIMDNIKYFLIAVSILYECSSQCHKIFSHGFVILNMALTYRLTIKMGV